MKFFVRLAIVIAIFVGVLLWLQNQSEQPSTTSATATPAASAPTPEAEPTPASPYPSLNATPTPTPMPTAVPPPQAVQRQGPAVGAASSSAACNHVRGLAPKARVTVVSCIDKDGWTVVTVSAAQRNDISDFLDVCQLNGMRDLAQDQTYRQIMDNQHRPVHLGTFRMKF